MRRVLAIGLDGYEVSVERRLIEAGELPALARLRKESARYLLDHGPAQRTGLAWEHVSTGLSPEGACRWAAVHFDPATYEVWQEGTRLKPFAAKLKSRTVVFDAPYYDLKLAPKVRGLVGWGAHDPGVPMMSRPVELQSELEARYGIYPAKDWIYGLVWQSEHSTQKMGEALARATAVRARACRWLLGERLPDWDLALVVVSEPHSAIEGLWQGIDPGHPLHTLPSARSARDGLLAVYRAVDQLVADLAADFPDAVLVLFSMGGMGPNRSDLASMILLPELMFRNAFGTSLFQQPSDWSNDKAILMLGEQEDWARAINANLPAPLARSKPRQSNGNLIRRVTQRLNGTWESSYPRQKIDWIPATRYQSYWNSMPAFALPSYYDGRIRINLAKREKKGIVPLSQYEQLCNEIETVLQDCRDPITGEGVVDHIERVKDRDPTTLSATESDIVVVWKGMTRAFDHPKLGRVGPVPIRRPGGHTGRYGMAYIRDGRMEAGDKGIRSSFDVVPTLIEMLGESLPSGLSGTSMLNGNGRIGD
jgi:predicted AlkP superfamily phosphohydrolase/phosphomutase